MIEEPKKLAYGIADLARALGISRDKVYDEIWADRLKARKIGSRTVIMAADVDDYLKNLPAYDGGKP